MKFARFDLSAGTPAAGQLPQPLDVVSLSPDALDQLDDLLRPEQWRSAAIWISSVQRTRTADLIAWLARRECRQTVRLLTSADLPLEIDLPHPGRTGIDRLLGAVAANVLRAPERPAAIVDLGTAITVDVVSAAGVFLGGAIAPGLAISAKALHDATDLLPAFDVSQLNERTPAIGRDTISAMQAGLFLGAVGGIRELITRQFAGPPEIFVTGGFGQQVAHLLSPDARFLPHLIPQGIAVALQADRWRAEP